MYHHALFTDRHDAGRQLAKELADYRADHPVILALPRGGVPVAYEIARALAAPCDLLMVQKIGAPRHDELGVGAVIDGAEPQLVLNDDLAQQLRVSPAYIQEEMHRLLLEIDRRRKAYLGNKRPIPINGRTIIIVDDGIATGSTVKAALRGVQHCHPAMVILAIPVAPAETIQALQPLCDRIICLHTPPDFSAVGTYYDNFRQVDDQRVITLLHQLAALSEADE